RISWLLERVEASSGRRIGRGMGLLASIGATAPFVGLFGTVWGIMNSFIGISNAHPTNLAVVAPGIAEALLATALGLFAAIPAVVIYNAFERSIGGDRARSVRPHSRGGNIQGWRERAREPPRAVFWRQLAGRTYGSRFFPASVG